MKIKDEGTSNAAYWHERATEAEARLQKIMARCADLLDEDQFNELDAIARADSEFPNQCPTCKVVWPDDLFWCPTCSVPFPRQNERNRNNV